MIFMRQGLLAAGLAASLGACVTPGNLSDEQARQLFVSMADADRSVVVEMRYFGPHNFIGRAVAGYENANCLLTKQAAAALKEVQAEVKAFGMALKVYDCYRPQRAVNDFVAWAKDASDTKMKKEFYPKVDKADLFTAGYIAEKSGHSRGSTVDLTLVPLQLPSQQSYRDGERLVECFASLQERFRDNSIDMGTGYDCFDPAAHTEHPQIPDAARRHRLLLKAVMEKHGFQNYEKEWWHFTLKDESYPETYFDFPVQ